jgi:hypothetical protein
MVATADVMWQLLFSENKRRKIYFANKTLVTYNERFQVLMAASMKMTASWDTTPCSLKVTDVSECVLLPPTGRIIRKLSS